MKPAGFLCKIDKLGRIVVPKPLRKKYDLNIEDTLELFTDDDSIIMKKYRTTCAFCGSDDDLVQFKGKDVCENCLNELKNQ